MRIKARKRGLRSTDSRPKRWERIGRTLGWGFLAVGVLLFLIGQISTHAASQKAPQPVGLIEESGWGYWYKGDIGQAFPTVQYPYALGQTVIVPSNVSIRVESVDRNWTPQPWQVSSFPVGYQDDAQGKEVILVRFTITNLSNTPVGYSDHYFSLVRANGQEQRVATLAELTGDQYGSFGQTSPWLQPGATVHTFVPFLVNPGENPQQFVFSWQVLDLSHISTVTDKGSGKEINLPAYINVARIPISLSTSVASSVTFAPDTTFTVTNADVYATTALARQR